MKFRRKSAPEAGSETPVPEEVEDSEQTSAPDEPVAADDGAPAEPEMVAAAGPVDADDLPEDDDVQRIDLGSLLIEPVEGHDLQLQVDEATQQIQAVLLAGADGALELRAFAAPRGGDLWAEFRPKAAAEIARHGGTATERQGRFGTELVCEIPARQPDGTPAVQPSRIIGINGPRWMLRATLLGRPAVDVDSAADWEDLLQHVVVRRGSQPMPVGVDLPLVLPPREQLTRTG